MQNEQNIRLERVIAHNPQYTPIRAFRFSINIKGLDSTRVHHVKSLPGNKLEVGFYIVEEGPELQRSNFLGCQGELSMLDAKGKIVRTVKFSSTHFEWLPFDFNYSDNKNLVQRILFEGVTYNP